jgi:NodT family efflux transporter outer membrane factor (OMF) lipoprotein
MNMPNLRYSIHVISIAFLTGLSACAAGPDFQRPVAPVVSHYAADDASGTVDAPGGKQSFPAGASSDQWWGEYGSTTLNAWVVEGLNNNRDLKSTLATLVAARERLAAQVGSSTLPEVGLATEYAHERALGLPNLGPPTDLYQIYAGVVQVNYDIDLFGGVRRANEAARAQFQAQTFELDAARETLVANIVATGIRGAALKKQIAATERIVALAKEEQHLTERRFELGAASHLNLLDAQRHSHEAAATLPQLKSAWSQNHHALAVLLGRTPEAAPEDIDFDTLTLPTSIPVTVPSELVRARPDILAAEATLHAASAQVGVATANMLPQLTLSGSFGSESFTRRGFLTGPTGVWSVIAGIKQPIFQGGALLAEKRASSAELDSALARYESAVLRAFQNVADSLRTLDEDARLAAERSASEIAARSYYEETASRHANGSLPLLTELQSEEVWQNERVGQIASQNARLIDSVALYQALGAPASSSGKTD